MTLLKTPNVSVLALLAVLASGCVYDTEGDAEAVQTLEQDIWALTRVPGQPGYHPLQDTYSVIDDATTGVAGAVVWVNQSCTGVLVSPTKVLTAAHCFDCDASMPRATIWAGPNAHQSGAHSQLGTYECSPYQGTENDEGDFDAGGDSCGANDVAIITLDFPVPASVVDYFPPVYLGAPQGFGLPTFTKTPWNDEDIDFEQTSHIYGYGRPCDSEDCQGDGVRRSVGVYAYLRDDPCGFNDNNCNDSPVWFLPERFGTGSSKGDSGGPLVDSYAPYGAETVFGVSSFDYSPTLGLGSHASVYAPVAVSLDQAGWVVRTLDRPDATSLQDVGIYSLGRTEINDRATVEGTFGAPATIIGGTVVLGVEAVSDGDVYAFYLITLRDRAEVTGNAQSYAGVNRQSPTVTIGGDVIYEPSRLPSIDFFTTCMSNITFGGSDIYLGPPNHHSFSEFEVTISPGSYGNVTIQRDRILRLEPGDYYFESLDVDSQGLLVAGGPLPGGVRIYVADEIKIKGSVYPEAGQLFIGYGGTSTVFVEADATATIVAPSADISVSSGKLFIGSIFGRDVTLHQEATFLHAPYAGTWCP